MCSFCLYIFKLLESKLEQINQMNHRLTAVPCASSSFAFLSVLNLNISVYNRIHVCI